MAQGDKQEEKKSTSQASPAVTQAKRDYELLNKLVYNVDGSLTSRGQLLIDKAMEQIAKGDSEMIRYFLERTVR